MVLIHPKMYKKAYGASSEEVKFLLESLLFIQRHLGEYPLLCYHGDLGSDIGDHADWKAYTGTDPDCTEAELMQRFIETIKEIIPEDYYIIDSE